MLGMAAAKTETWRGAKMLGASISTTATGRVVRIEHQASGRVRITLDLLATERPRLRHAPHRIRVSARRIPNGVRAGSVVTGLVRMLPPSGPVRPDGYDFAFKSFMSGIGATGFFLRGPFEAEFSGSPPLGAALRAWSENLRLALADRISGRIGGAEGQIAAALMTGVRAGIPEQVNESLRQTGLAHVLSISGMHMALVAGTVMFTLRLLFALAPGFASRHPVRKYAAAAGLFSAACYLVASGAAVAAQRSFIMVAVMLVALLFDRAALTMRNLAIAALIVIAVAPHEVSGPSFQMSFAATAALIGAYGYWSERRARRITAIGAPPRSALRRAARICFAYVTGIAATSIIAGFATALYGVWHFHRAAPLGLVANLAAMPIVSVVIMPSAVAAAILMPLGLDGGFLDLMGKGIGMMIRIAAWLSERTPFDAVGAIPASSVVLLTAALILLTLPTTKIRWLAAPFLVGGLAVLGMRSFPAAHLAEDARLVAVRMPDGALAVNRQRPNAFTMRIWQAAATAPGILKPEKAAAPEQAIAVRSGASGFICDDGLCLARHAGGAIVAHAADGRNAARVCSMARVIVVEDAPRKPVCAGSNVLIVSQGELASRGSAEIRFIGEQTARIRFAIAEPYRPWHLHRAFARPGRR
jgi:ComEC/Rec2-related protein